MKQIIQYTLFTVGLLVCQTTYSQHALFLNQGNISFERSTNVLAILKENETKDHVWAAKMVDAYEKSGTPAEVKARFNLAFNGAKTVYAPIESDEPKAGMMQFVLSAASDNTVYTNLDSGRSITYKNIFDENFLVRDSVRAIHWKITDETRTIAGFSCRRANALVMDSIYVVAFYTDMIPTSGGPESFTGLPGMILGLALPHKHMTWFATKVSVSPPVAASSLIPPTGKRKTEVTDRKALYERLNKRLGEWGLQGNMILQNALL